VEKVVLLTRHVMKIINEAGNMRNISRQCRKEGLKIGLVPTMGYFHDGHLALMKEARRHADRVVVSLFVNPAQFGPEEDLDRYPRNLERDAKLAEDSGVDYLFTPTADRMYGQDYQTWIEVEHLSKGLCGASRPGHFRGVATIVTKLFNIVQPDVAIFGMKDFQQLQVIRQMVRDLDMDIEIIGHPIVREHDGLAMSSRNKYLSQDERQKALCLYRALMKARRTVEEGERSSGKLRALIESEIVRHENARIDYIFIGDPDTLKPFETTINGKQLLVALAVYIGSTRLIDNILITT
jgi:pantoate--beta-alanine ligase